MHVQRTSRAKRTGTQRHRIAVINMFATWANSLATEYWVKTISGIQDIAVSGSVIVDFIDRTMLSARTTQKIVRDYAGVIAAVPNDAARQRMWQAIETRLPSVSLMSMPRVRPRAFVGTDDALAIRKIMSHLCEEGHRSFIYAGLDVESYAATRRQAFLASLPRDAEKRTFNYRHLYAAHGPYAPDRAAEELLSEIRHRPADAVIFESDFLASRFIKHAVREGISIPADVAVTGFNDVPEHPLPVALTTIRHDGVSIGRTAARMLIAQIRGSGGTGRTLIEPALIIRRSSLNNSLGDGNSDAFRYFVEARIREWHPYPEMIRSLPNTLGMSRTRFSRRFTRVFRKNLVAYVNDVRIASAARSLSGSDDGITTIAMNSGFNNHTNFMKFFRRAYGCTPSEYRARMRTD